MRNGDIYIGNGSQWDLWDFTWIYLDLMGWNQYVDLVPRCTKENDRIYWLGIEGIWDILRKYHQHNLWTSNKMAGRPPESILVYNPSNYGYVYIYIHIWVSGHSFFILFLCDWQRAFCSNEILSLHCLLWSPFHGPSLDSCQRVENGDHVARSCLARSVNVRLGKYDSASDM